jgi:hypothetical protein
MAMKTKTLLFVPESNMFVGANYDNNNQLGIVTFTDHNTILAKARELTDKLLENDKSYLFLTSIKKRNVYDKEPILSKQAFKTATDMWTTIFHQYLINELERNGWIIFEAKSEDFKDLDLAKNHMQI